MCLQVLDNVRAGAALMRTRPPACFTAFAAVTLAASGTSVLKTSIVVMLSKAPAAATSGRSSKYCCD
jgi:hypothetical protein